MADFFRKVEHLKKMWYTECTESDMSIVPKRSLDAALALLRNPKERSRLLSAFGEVLDKHLQRERSIAHEQADQEAIEEALKSIRQDDESSTTS
jgi:hypothetical protein